MPTYEYYCDACQENVEVFQKMSEEPLEVCPKCGEKALRRLISGGSGLIFKGSGFYITDYKNKSTSSAPASK